MPDKEHGLRVTEQAPILHICRDGMIVAVPGRASRFIAAKDSE